MLAIGFPVVADGVVRRRGPCSAFYVLRLRVEGHDVGDSFTSWPPIALQHQALFAVPFFLPFAPRFIGGYGQAFFRLSGFVLVDSFAMLVTDPDVLGSLCETAWMEAHSRGSRAELAPVRLWEFLVWDVLGTGRMLDGGQDDPDSKLDQGSTAQSAFSPR